MTDNEAIVILFGMATLVLVVMFIEHMVDIHKGASKQLGQVDVRDAHPKCGSCSSFDPESNYCYNDYNSCQYVQDRDYCRFHSAFENQGGNND